MQFIRTAIWVAIAVVLVLFSVGNWKHVEVGLWSGVVLETPLPVLVIGAFLIGALPMWGAWRASKWRLKRRLESTERALASALAPPVPPAGGQAEPAPETLGADPS